MINLENFSREIASKWWKMFKEELSGWNNPASQIILNAAEQTETRLGKKGYHESLLFIDLLDPIRRALSEVSGFWQQSRELFRRCAEINGRIKELKKGGIHEVEEAKIPALFGDLVKDPDWAYSESLEVEHSDAEKALVAFVKERLGEHVPVEKLGEFSKQLLQYVDLEKYE